MRDNRNRKRKGLYVGRNGGKKITFVYCDLRMDVSDAARMVERSKALVWQFWRGRGPRFESWRSQ